MSLNDSREIYFSAIAKGDLVFGVWKDGNAWRPDWVSPLSNDAVLFGASFDQIPKDHPHIKTNLKFIEGAKLVKIKISHHVEEIL